MVSKPTIVLKDEDFQLFDTEKTELMLDEMSLEDLNNKIISPGDLNMRDTTDDQQTDFRYLVSSNFALPKL